MELLSFIGTDLEDLVPVTVLAGYFGMLKLKIHIALLGLRNTDCE